MSKLMLIAEGSRHIVGTRRFSAQPEAVYRAHLECELIRQWMLGPPGWSMSECVNDPRPGGKFRYGWRNENGASFFITGEFVELVPGSRISHVERMHLPEPTPDYRVLTTFEREGSGTSMSIRLTFLDEVTRQAMLSTGMEMGMEASFMRLEAISA